MIISKTPFRLSLFGGGTDYPTWYREHGGAVLGTAINKYCYISVRYLPPFFEHRHRFVYSQIEAVNSLDEIDHPAIRGILTDYNVKEGLEIHHDGDLPARSGLGSSSSFTVGLINALRALQGKMSSAKFLGEEAIRIEQQVLKENVGSQDQIWAAYGGTNTINFQPDGTISVDPVIMSKARRQELESHITLYFTGLARIASDIAGSKIANLSKRKAQLGAMCAMVDEARGILASSTSDIRDIGRMLHESWKLKRELADNVSTSEVDEYYQAAIDAGALGGKLLGAGGGGFMMVFCEPDKQPAVQKALGGLIPVKISIGSPGSTIAVYEPDLGD